MAQLKGSSTSDLSAFCDSFYGEHSDFHFLDGDEIILRYSAQPVVYARESGVLRVVESKRPGEEIRRSQREALPLLAGCIALGIESGIVADGSGVFIVTGEPPYTAGAKVAKLRQSGRTAGLQYEIETHLSRERLIRFMRCRR